MELSGGKLWRLRRLADEHGHFRMLAVDQRPPIERLLTERRGELVLEDVATVKRALIERLGREVSAVLVDPLVAYPFGIDLADPSRGLLVTLEHAVYEETPGGRQSGPIPGWSVESILHLGGDAVKVLAWYRPDAHPAVREHQQAWVAEVGEECRRHDLPFVFELLVYPFAAESGHGDAYAEDGGKRAEAVIESVETFADPTFGVDLFKLESPVPAADLVEEDDSRFEDQRGWFHALDRAAGRPWVVLSAGAEKEGFTRVLGHALAAGASGFLAGRAIWWDAVDRFPDIEAMKRWLDADALAYLRTLNDATRANARPWHSHDCHGPKGPSLAGAGPEFVERYRT